jgi:ribonuclease P protein component
MKQFTLGKKERLKSRKQIEQLFDNGQRFSVATMRILYSFQKCPPTIKPQLRAGFVASSRNFKTAVDRNRIKRLIKEAWRLQKNELEKTLYEQTLNLNVFFIYAGRDLPAYDDIYSNMKKIILKLNDISNKVE